MKLKDGFYASSHGIGGLMLDMPTKNPKTRKKPKVKVGDMVRCEAEGFIYPFRGYVEHVYNHSAIIRIEKTRKRFTINAKTVRTTVSLIPLTVILVKTM